MTDSFQAFDPNAEVIGRSMLANFHNLNKEHFIPVLEAHGILEINPQAWYPQQLWLDILKEVAATAGDGMFDFVAVGMSVATLAPFPPNVKTIPQAFEAMGKVYAANHRNGYVGEWVCESTTDHSVFERVKSPYPDDFLYGVVYGITKRYVPAGQPILVTRSHQGDMCCFTISW